MQDEPGSADILPSLTWPQSGWSVAHNQLTQAPRAKEEVVSIVDSRGGHKDEKERGSTRGLDNPQGFVEHNPWFFAPPGGYLDESDSGSCGF